MRDAARFVIKYLVDRIRGERGDIMCVNLSAIRRKIIFDVHPLKIRRVLEQFSAARVPGLDGYCFYVQTLKELLAKGGYVRSYLEPSSA